MKTKISLKQLIGASYLGFTLCLLALPGHALTVKEVPNPRQVAGNWVTDRAEILKPATETQLNRMINQLEKKNGAEIAVVTVPETQPAASPKAFATELFNYWHIGKKGRDNGVLFLISKGDRRVEIETGYGVEAKLPDAEAGTIIDTEVLPRFKQNDFDGGTLAGTRLIVTTLEPSLAQELQIPIGRDLQPSQGDDSNNLLTGLFVFAFGAIGLRILYLALRRSRGDSENELPEDERYVGASSEPYRSSESNSENVTSDGDSNPEPDRNSDAWLGWFFLNSGRGDSSGFFGGSGSGGSDSGGSSGGGSFGGGDSGGGGAGGSW